MYALIWHEEEIDTAETEDEARYLRGEYMLAFDGPVEIVYREEDDA